MDNNKVEKLIDRFVDTLGYEYQLSKTDIMNLFIEIEETLTRKEVLMPISIYNNKELSTLETSCKYLKEELNLTYHKIGELLNRDERTIWVTYQNAKRKRQKSVVVRPTNVVVPASVLKNRALSILESLVTYLRDKFNLRFSEIAILLNRDERNIWTVHNRARKKILKI